MAGEVEMLTFLLPFIVQLSIYATCALTGALVLYILSPPTARLLIKKKLFAMKGTLTGIFLDNRAFVIDNLLVYPSGAMEHPKLKWVFYLPRSLTALLSRSENQADQNNVAIENSQLQELETQAFPPYTLDGFPIMLSYSAKAIATTPDVIAGLEAPSRIMTLKGNQIETLNNGGSMERKGFLSFRKPKQNNEPQLPKSFRVLLPLNPLLLKKYFGNFWSQSQLQHDFKRHEDIGAEGQKSRDKTMLYAMIIIGVTSIVAAVALRMLG